jgi:hypothetical protein
MTLLEAKEKYLDKTCNVYWGPLDRPERKGESIPVPTKVQIKSVYQNAYNEVFFTCYDTLHMPFSVLRLQLL